MSFVKVVDSVVIGMDVSVGPADSDETSPRVTRAIVILKACEEMSRPAIAREGALNNLSPALGACAARGENGRAGFVAAEAVTTKCLGGVRLCSGRLCGRGLLRHFRAPRSARAPSTGLRLLSAPSRATETSSQTSRI